MIPVSQWTHDGHKVRILKCVQADGTSYDGFRWPESGSVQCPLAQADPARARIPECETGGLFGWAWGLGRDGKAPNFCGRWIVFEADPADVIEVGLGKVKAVGECAIIFSGEWWLAWSLVAAGAVAWIHQASRGAASATGWSGAASATGWRGAASATGERGAASATGGRGAASATGEGGAASATGGRGAASATGERGVAALTGLDGAVEAGPGGICAVTTDTVTWVVHRHAVLVQRWYDAEEWLTCVFIPAKMGWKTGDRVRITRGTAAMLEEAS